MRLKTPGWIVSLLALPVFGLALEEPNDKASGKPIEMADILAWKSIRSAGLSDDGRWLAYRLSPNEGDSQVVVRRTEGDTEYRFDVGEASRGGGGGSSTALAFSADGRYLAFTISPTQAEKKKQSRARSASRTGPARPESASSRRTFNKAGIVDLSSGELETVEKIRSFSFSGDNPDWIALHRYPADNQGRGDEAWKGSDLLLRRLGTETQFLVGNVSEYEFDEAGRFLAWALDARDGVGNGVVVRNLTSGVDRPLDSAEASYERLGWSEDGDALAVLRGVKDEAFEERRYALLGWKAEDWERTEYDPASDDGFPEAMSITSRRSPVWAEDLETLFIGIRELTPKEKDKGGRSEETAEGPDDESPEPGRGRSAGSADEDSETAGLVIWHWKDSRLQSMQQVQESRDKSFSFLAGWRVAEGRLVRLADEAVPDVSIEADDRYAVGRDDSRYELMGNLDGRRYQDIYAVDALTGERTLAIEKVRWYSGASPDGKKLLYFRDGHYHVYDIESATHRNITGSVPTSFIDTEDDHNIVDPPVRPLGWAADGGSVVLSDNWDLWQVRVDGSGGRRLTSDGRKEGIRYRRRFSLDPDEEGIDFSRPLYLEGFQERTKKAGIFRLAGDAAPERLLWDDALFSVDKADEADVYVYARQTHDEYPDYYVTGPDLADGRRLTEANPQQKEFRWSSGARVIDYTGAKGDALQAALFLPAGYQEGQQYPTIVYIYERLSQRLNSYDAPSANGFDKTVYTSNGYAVLMPDIAYEVDDPGMSAVWCVLPALKAAVETGIVDPQRVGLHGHSWGGYQTSFLITQTDAFAAAVAGAPLTNMISMYSSVYWNTGGVNGAIFESSQGRFTGGPWDVPEAYTRNSPVYFAENVTTPLIILHNDKDGAVDFNQGIEYFNTLRRLQKPVVMLQYEGENHGLRIAANQKDYTVRMREFFDHYLKGEPMPVWLQKGVSHLDHEKHLKERAVP